MSSTRVYDRVPNWQGGMDAYRYAAELDKNQSQLLQNMVVLDNGRAVTRPGADQIDSNPATFANINPVGAVQGLAFLDNLTYQLLLMGQGGKLYTWNGSAWSNALAFALTSATAQFAAVQGVDALLISDGEQGMQFWDGLNFTAASSGPNDTSATHGPTGATSIAFIAGMFVCAGPAMLQGTGSGVQQFQADALIFSNYLPAVVTPGTTPDVWANATQSFRVGNGDGEAIVAITPIQSTASTYPIYNLAVLKENSVWVVGIQPGTTAAQFVAFFASFATSPQGDQVGTGIGCVGRNAWCLFQNDLLFMSQDGVQSLQRMQAAAGQYQLTAPLSLPIQPYIDRINWGVAYNIQAIKYKQLAIFFVPLDNSPVNNYALVWNGRIGKWMIWTGWTPEAVCVTRFGRQIQLVVGNSDGSVNQWKDSQALYGLDKTYQDNGTPIPWQINTRALVFGNLDFQKKPEKVLVRFNAGNATVNLSAFLDLADSDDWNSNVVPSGATLPFVLPVVLASSKPVEAFRSLLGLPYCNELYFEIGAASGWADIRNIVASAYMKTLRDPNA